MARTLIYKVCGNTSTGSQTREAYWDSNVRQVVYLQAAPVASCSNFYIAENTLLDSWCDGTTKVEIRSKGSLGGRPERYPFTQTEIENAPSCGFNPCGLSITDVIVEETSPNLFKVVILTSSVSGTLEYSLNNFTDVQASNVFENLAPGDFKAYVRVK